MDTEYPQIESGDRILPEISDGWFHILEKRDAILLMIPIVMFSTVILNKRSRAILTHRVHFYYVRQNVESSVKTTYCNVNMFHFYDQN